MEIKSYTPLSSFIDLLLDAVCVVDKEGHFVFVSAACERIFGYTPGEMVGKAMIEMVFPEDRERTLEAARQIMSGNPQPYFENRYLRKDGRVVHIMWSTRWSQEDQLRIAVARDITKRKQAESVQAAIYAISEAAHTSDDLPDLCEQVQKIIGKLLPALNFSVALYDEANNLLNFAYHIDTYNRPPTPQQLAADTLIAEVIRSGQALLLTPETMPYLKENLRAAVDQDSLSWLGVPLNSASGTIGVLAVKSYLGGARYSEQDKELLQFVSTQVAAAIERKQLHARLKFMAQYDQLTQLPNRALLQDRLTTALARARREQGQLCLLFIDLDNFKQINDTLGHAAGDLLLQEVARRLNQCVRDTDTVARIGGDEFVVLIEHLLVPEHVSTVAEKILSRLNQPLDLAGQCLSILPSIGAALYPEHGKEAEQLLKHADHAMYYAKNNGGNRFHMPGEPGPGEDGVQLKPPHA